MKDALVATVVHDLKNALSSLTSSTGDIAGRAAGSELELDATRLHATTVALSQRLVGFLTVYRSAQAGLSAQLRDHTPEDFLREVAAGLVLPPEAVGINVAECEDGAPFWFFDDYLTRMALEAAVHNALRFARSEVVLACAVRNGFLVFSVADDGPGLGADAEPSTGLGTVLCQAIARAHTHGERTGKVVLGNRPEGGALFELWLP
ncbi:MAG TPA: HAMP domain-containing sensor histidine kinase [Burkholderiales bacterium]|nr:HAMP domain-containing sensor histidine kinase [Burkholderiales bacterium]